MTAIALTPVQKRFILHWGEMGTRWGINRTVAQIHSLLYLWPEPLNAEDIAETLGVARSNVSNSLRELQGWGIVRVTHELGDRRDHFEAMTDVWEMFRIIVDQRKRREIDPAIEMLRDCVKELKWSPRDPYTSERVADMLEFMTTMTALYEEVKDFSPKTLKALSKLRGKLKVLNIGGKKK